MKTQIAKSELLRQAEWVNRNIHKERALSGSTNWTDYRTKTGRVKFLADNPNANYED